MHAKFILRGYKLRAHYLQISFTIYINKTIITALQILLVCNVCNEVYICMHILMVSMQNY